MTLQVARAAFREVPPLEQVVDGPITFVAHCEHDGMPYFGRAFVGYVPTSERLGATTLRRMVKQAARHGEHRLERDVASMLQVCIRPAGIALAIRSAHDCAGPHLLEDSVPTFTAWHGRYRADRALRSDFLARCARSERELAPPARSSSLRRRPGWQGTERPSPVTAFSLRHGSSGPIQSR